MSQIQSSELFSILKSLSKREMFRFWEYLKSPYFNKSRKKIELFDYLKEFYPLFTDIRADKRAVFEKIYPGKTYNDSTMRNLFSDLHNDALNFLAINNFTKEDNNKYKYLIKELNIKNLVEQWGNTIEKFDFECETGADYNYFLNKHISEVNKFNYNHLREKIAKEKILTEGLNFLNNSTINLLYFFITDITTNYLAVLSYSRQFDFDAAGNLTSKTMSLIDFSKFLSLIPEIQKNKFIIILYQKLLQMYSDIGDEKLYYDYKEFFTENIDKLSKDEIALHYSKLTGYCILKLQLLGTSGEFSKELFNLYNNILQKEYYKDNKSIYLTHEYFRNILMHALRIREYSWTNEFIKTYSTTVHPDDIENMYSYGQAYLNYHLGNYGESLKHLQLINPDFIFHKFDVKNLTLMVYFELGYYEESLYLIRTYLEFLRKNRVLNTERKKRYLNFVKFTEKIILYKFGSSKHDLGYIRHRLTNHNMTAFKPWLMEKISSLEAGFGKAV